jgi:hypothetical protein
VCSLPYLLCIQDLWPSARIPATQFLWPSMHGSELTSTVPCTCPPPHHNFCNRATPLARLCEGGQSHGTFCITHQHVCVIWGGVRERMRWVATSQFLLICGVGHSLTMLSNHLSTPPNMTFLWSQIRKWWSSSIPTKSRCDHFPLLPPSLPFRSVHWQSRTQQQSLLHPVVVWRRHHMASSPSACCK